MKRYEIMWKSLRAAGLCLLAAGVLAACDDEEFVRDAGTMPVSPDGTPSGALYVAGSLNTDAEILSISADTEIGVVYRLNLPALEDVTVTLAVGTQKDIDVYNDANGLADYLGQYGGYARRYQMLPETNYTLPNTLTLTVAKGETQSAPLDVQVIYDDNLLLTMGGRMRNPWMLPLCVESVEGRVTEMRSGQCLGLGIRPANRVGTEYFADNKQDKLFNIAFADCRVIMPYLINAYCTYYGEYVPASRPGRYTMADPIYAMTFDVECLRPAFIAGNAEKQAVLKVDADLAYVLKNQARYLDPVRERRIKICVAVETEKGSPAGLCNLDDEFRASLIWQIKKLVTDNDLDGVSLNDAGANYAVEGAPAVDKASYTKFLKALREALGDDKLILVSYDADENAALYEEHDGLRAGDYISAAWWAKPNVICDPYAEGAVVRPILGLEARNFGPISGETVDTPEYREMWHGVDGGLDGYTAYAREHSGSCRVNAWLNIPLNVQGFMEFDLMIIPGVYGHGVWYGGDSKTPGWGASSEFTQVYYYPEWGDVAGYEGGKKDW